MGGRLLAPLGGLWIEGGSGLLGAALITEAGFLAARRVGGGAGVRLFAAAYGLRVLLTLPSHVLAKSGNGNGALFQDDYTYDLVGEWLARIARGDGLTIFAGHQYLLYGAYDYLLMPMYVVFGHTPLLPKLLNGALAALCAVLLMEIARQAFRPVVGLVAGVAAAILPTMVIWSIVTLEEVLVLFVALVGLRALHIMTQAPLRSTAFADALVALAAALALTFDLRTTTCLILFSLLLLMLLVRAPFRRRPWQLGLSSLALLVLIVGGLFAFRGYVSARPPAGVLEDVVLQLRHRRAQEAAVARSQIRSGGRATRPRGSPTGVWCQPRITSPWARRGSATTSPRCRRWSRPSIPRSPRPSASSRIVCSCFVRAHAGHSPSRRGAWRVVAQPERPGRPVGAQYPGSARARCCCNSTAPWTRREPPCWRTMPTVS